MKKAFIALITLASMIFAAGVYAAENITVTSSVSPSTPTYSDSTSITVSLAYTETDLANEDGLRFQMYYDSSKLTFGSWSSADYGAEIYDTGMIPVSDSGNADSDANTDMYLNFSWGNLSGTWPDSLTGALATVDFTTNIGSNSSTVINHVYVDGSLSSSSNFTAQSLTLHSPDTQGPSVTSPVDTSIAATALNAASYTLPATGTATDSVSGDVSDTIQVISVNGSTVTGKTPGQTVSLVMGTNTLIWQATDGSGNDGTDTQTVTVTAGAVSASTSMVAATTNVAADNSALSTVTVTVKDANNNLVSGQSVFITVSGLNNIITANPVSSDASGTATFTFKSTTAEQKTITAYAGSDASGTEVTNNATATFIAGAASASTSMVMATSSIVADGSSTSTVTITVKDVNNNPVSGQQIFVVSSGSGSVTQSASTTDSLGIATATVTNTVAESVTITAYLGADASGTMISDTASVGFIPGSGDAAQSMVVVSAGDVTADGIDSATVTVTLKDAQANLIGAGTQVNIAVTGTSNTIMTNPTTTDASSTATFIIKSTKAESKTVTAYVGADTSGIAISDTESLTFVAGEPEQLTFTAIREVMSSEATDSITVSAIIKDVNGNIVHNATDNITFAVIGGDASGSATFTSGTVAPSNGEATDTLNTNYSGGGSHTVQIKAYPTGDEAQDDPTITINLKEFSISNSLSTLANKAAAGDINMKTSGSGATLNMTLTGGSSSTWGKTNTASTLSGDDTSGTYSAPTTEGTDIITVTGSVVNASDTLTLNVTAHDVVSLVTPTAAMAIQQGATPFAVEATGGDDSYTFSINPAQGVNSSIATFVDATGTQIGDGSSCTEPANDCLVQVASASSATVYLRDSGGLFYDSNIGGNALADVDTAKLDGASLIQGNFSTNGATGTAPSATIPDNFASIAMTSGHYLGVDFNGQTISGDAYNLSHNGSDNTISFTVGSNTDTATVSSDGVVSTEVFTNVDASDSVSLTFTLNGSGTATGPLGVMVEDLSGTGRRFYALLSEAQVNNGVITVPADATLYVTGVRADNTVVAKTFSNAAVNVFDASGTELTVNLDNLRDNIESQGISEGAASPTGYFRYMVLVDHEFPIAYKSGSSNLAFPSVPLSAPSGLALTGSNGIFNDPLIGDVYASGSQLTLLEMLDSGYLIQGEVQVNGATESVARSPEYALDQVNVAKLSVDDQNEYLMIDASGSLSEVAQFSNVTENSDVEVTFHVRQTGSPTEVTDGTVGMIVEDLQAGNSRKIYAVLNPIQVAADGSVTIPADATIKVAATDSSGGTVSFATASLTNATANVVTATGSQIMVSLNKLRDGIKANMPQLNVNPTGYFNYMVFVKGINVGYHDGSNLNSLPTIPLTGSGGSGSGSGTTGIFTIGVTDDLIYTTSDGTDTNSATSENIEVFAAATITVTDASGTTTYSESSGIELAIGTNETMSLATAGLNGSFTFVSDATDVFTVDASGTVTAVAAGSGNLTITNVPYGDVTRVIPVTVDQITIKLPTDWSGTTDTSRKSVQPGETIAFEVNVQNSAGTNVGEKVSSVVVTKDGVDGDATDSAILSATANPSTVTWTAPKTGPFAGKYELVIGTTPLGLTETVYLEVPMKLTVESTAGKTVRALLSNDGLSGDGLGTAVKVSGAPSGAEISFAVMKDGTDTGTTIASLYDATDSGTASVIATVADMSGDYVGVKYIDPVDASDTSFTIKATVAGLGSIESPELTVYKVSPVGFTVTEQAGATASLSGTISINMDKGPIRTALEVIGVTVDATGTAGEVISFDLPAPAVSYQFTVSPPQSQATIFDAAAVTLSSLTDQTVTLSSIASPVTYAGTVTVPSGKNGDIEIAILSSNSSKFVQADASGTTMATYSVTVDTSTFTPVALVASGDGLIAYRQDAPTLAADATGTTVDFVLQAVPVEIELTTAQKETKDTQASTIQESTALSTITVAEDKGAGQAVSQKASALGGTLQTAVNEIANVFETAGAVTIDDTKTDVFVKVAADGNSIDEDAPVTLILRDASDNIVAAPVLFKKLEDVEGETRVVSKTETKPAEIGGGAQEFDIPEMVVVQALEVNFPTDAFKDNVGAVFTSVRAAKVSESSESAKKAALTGGEVIEIDLAVLDASGTGLASTSDKASDNVVKKVDLSLPLSDDALETAGYEDKEAIAAGFSSGNLVVYTAPSMADFEAGLNITTIPGATYNPLTGKVDFTMTHFSIVTVGQAAAAAAAAAAGGGCFIATAAYGSYEAPYVKLLREFRDQYLLTNEPGQWFVEQYYTYSPPMADWIRDREAVKSAVRVVLLPLIGFALLLFQIGPILTLLLFAGGLIGIGALLVRRRSRQPALQAD